MTCIFVVTGYVLNKVSEMNFKFANMHTYSEMIHYVTNVRGCDLCVKNM